MFDVCGCDISRNRTPCKAVIRGYTGIVGNPSLLRPWVVAVAAVRDGGMLP